MSARFQRILLIVALCVGSPSLLWSGEADDLQNMISRAKQGASDLERMDERKGVRDEIMLLRVWLDDAWKMRAEQKYDEVRIVLDRCDAQADMVREKITAADLAAQVLEKEAAVKAMRAKIEKTKRAIVTIATEKAALEARAK